MGHATTTIAAALADALVRQSEAMAKDLPEAIDGDVNAVHRARVASRRLREALALVGAVAGNGVIGRLEKSARRLTQALGPVREFDVALQVLDAAAGRHGWTSDDVLAVRLHLERGRGRRRRRMATALRREDVESLVTRCRVAAEVVAASDARDHQAWWRVLSLRVSRRARALGTAVAACGTVYAPDRLHQVRLAVKKLRYTLEFAPAAEGVDFAKALTELTQAQRMFGRLHDVQVLLGEARAVGAKGRRAMPPAAPVVDAAPGGVLDQPDRSESPVSGAVSEPAHAPVQSPVPVPVQVTDALDADCRCVHAGLLQRLPDLRRDAVAVRREVAARVSGRRMPLIKVSMRSALAPRPKRPASLPRRARTSGR